MLGATLGAVISKADKNIKLATYASRCIENEILMHLRSIKKLGAEVYLNEPIGKDKDDNEISLIDFLEEIKDKPNAVIILDEAQNTTVPQIKMFLTRLGANAKMIITGDMSQIDLPSTQTSGLVQAINILGDIKGIGFVRFDKSDIVRHRLVQAIVEAYDAYDKKQREKKISKEKNN